MRSSKLSKNTRFYVVLSFAADSNIRKRIKFLLFFIISVNKVNYALTQGVQKSTFFHIFSSFSSKNRDESHLQKHFLYVFVSKPVVFVFSALKIVHK